MTVTVESHHGSLVDVKVLEKKHEGNSYARKILLTLQSNGRIVMFGLVRIWLHYCSPEVRAEILEEQTPLGRILINHKRAAAHRTDRLPACQTGAADAAMVRADAVRGGVRPIGIDLLRWQTGDRAAGDRRAGNGITSPQRKQGFTLLALRASQPLHET